MYMYPPTSDIFGLSVRVMVAKIMNIWKSCIKKGKYFLYWPLRQFEMLVILAVGPIAAPFETFCLEEAVAEVTFLYLVVELLGAVEVGFASGRFCQLHAIAQLLVVGIVECVDVDGGTFAVLRNRLGVRDEAEIEGGGVVVAHRLLVISVPVIYQSHPLDGVFRLVELVEDVEHIVSHFLVYHHLAHEDAPVLVYVQALQVVQFAAWYGAVVLEALALHQGEDAVGDGDGEEETLGSGFLYSRGGHDVSGVESLLLAILCGFRCCPFREALWLLHVTAASIH